MRKVEEKERKLSSAFTKHGGYLAEDDEPEYFILPTIVAERENIPPVEQQNDEAEPSVEQDNQQRADFNTNTAKSEESEQRNSIRSRSISVSGVRTNVTVEKITPAIPSRTFSRSDKVQDEQQLTGYKDQPQNANFGSTSSDTQRRRIDPFKVGEIGDLLDRIQERERSRSTPRESAKKPKDYYKHLHKRGRDQ